MSNRKVRVVSVEKVAGGVRRIRTDDGRLFLAQAGPGTARLLEPGAVLDQRNIEALEGPVTREAGIFLALRILARRDRTVRQVREALSAAGITDPGAADHIVGALTDAGYLDDRRYAAEQIAFRKAQRSAGPGLLRRTLCEAGVSREIVEGELSRAFPPGEERRAAQAAASQRLAGSKAASREAEARRLHGFLRRRGFSAEVVGKICAAVLRGERIGAGDERVDPNGQ